MKTHAVVFRSLAELAAFFKTIQPKSYTINTLHVTLTAPLTPFELAIAIEQYNAEEVQTAIA